jgi:carboxypeptidase Taq
MEMNEAAARFTDRCREIHDLGEIQALLEWDQQVTMPPRGTEQRGAQMAALAGLIHARLTDPALGDLIASLEDHPGLDGDRRADVREARRARDRAVRIPAALVTARAEACALAQGVWVEARRTSDFGLFRPHLEKVLDLTRQVAAAIGTPDPYDALLDEYEPGMTAAALRGIFDGLRPRLTSLLERIRGASRRPDPAILKRPCPAAAQEAFCRRLMADQGYDLTAGRLDASVHPFTSGTFGDVRITTRYDERWLPTALFGLLHEAGHAIYEQGLDPARYRDPAGATCSLGIHESQSRFWENLVGRSRPFWRHYYPLLKEAFPGTFDDVPDEGFYRAVNTVAPSLVRVEADEVTYNLHIILRFELEVLLVAGRLAVADLPEAWNERMRIYLGLTPPSDALGVLQDIHWSAGAIGYFPTYALGNLYAAQFMERLRADLPDLDGRVARGELAPVKAWLNEKIHRPGRRWLAPELCERVTGRPLSAEPALAHLEAKYADIYAL